MTSSFLHSKHLAWYLITVGALKDICKVDGALFNTAERILIYDSKTVATAGKEILGGKRKKI